MSKEPSPPPARFESLRTDVASYYGRKVLEHGVTARGVDWNSTESQTLRFEQLLRLIPTGAGAFTVLDYGCGYGALLELLRARFPEVRYVGYDLSPEMVARAVARHGTSDRWRFTTNVSELAISDYVLASGVLNVRLHHSEEEWSAYFEDTLAQLARLARLGFAFNALSSYSDVERRRSDLYYADPLRWFDRCKRSYSRFVTLVHDYPLYEFTILVTLASPAR